MSSPVRLAALAAAAITLLVASQLVSAASGPSAAGPAVMTDHYLRSGLLSVAASGEQVRLSTVNTSGKAQTVVLRLHDATGSVVTKKSVTLAAGKSTTLSFDPTSATRLWAEFLLTADGSFQCNFFPTTLELLQSVSGVLRSRLVLDVDWHVDETVA